MSTRRPRLVATIVFGCLLAVATSVFAENAWMLWAEVPAGSDHWTVAPLPQSKFKAKEDCQRQAQELNEQELAIAKMERASEAAHDLFVYLPDTVDPRPEGALRSPDTVDPRGPKGGK
jgi:hypothetical protein